MSHYPIENKVVNEVETNSSFTCKDESKSFGTKIVGINASKRIIRFWFQYFIEIISFYFSERWMVNKWRKYQKENDLVHAKRKRELLSLWCCTARKRSKTGCGVFLPEHMLKLAMSELEKFHSWFMIDYPPYQLLFSKTIETPKNLHTTHTLK